MPPRPRPPGDPKKWNDPQTRHVDVVEPDVWISQYGRATSDGKGYEFREEPRWEQQNPIEYDVSMKLGHCTPDEVGKAVRGMTPPERIRKRERVRWFKSEDLIDAGYMVLHTPTYRNPDHVSVMAPIEPEQVHDLETNVSWWADPERVTLDKLKIGIGGDPT